MTGQGDAGNTRVWRAFEYATGLYKQILTLTTAIVAVTASFAKQLTGSSDDATAWLVAAWAFYGFSILAGLLALMGLTGLVGGPRPYSAEDGAEAGLSPNQIWDPWITTPGTLQVFAFLIGTVLLLVAASYGLATVKAWLVLSGIAVFVVLPSILLGWILRGRSSST